MGILNVTPDSFADGGRYLLRDQALQHALDMVAAGADYIDVGGESTRPGATPISIQQELDRVIPVIELLADAVDVTISIDTSQPQVMQEAVKAGAGMINDVRALQRPGALAVAATCQVPVCLMHLVGEPSSMQNDPHYDDVVVAVMVFLQARIDAALAAGIEVNHLIVDPGFGFGKTQTHNLQMVAQLNTLQQLGCPILLGASRKSTLGVLTGKAVEDRLAASLAMVAWALWQQVAIIRVHDVAATVDFIKVFNAVAQHQTIVHTH
ncbi:MAG: dihydropteroate synthase [Legionellales bacterium]|nr:dihydropteroate synthase [Legionellales bacterium]